MTIFISILCLIFFLYCLIYFRFKLKPSEKNSDIELLHVSIIIAAKNEEHNLRKLFHSLNKLNYPKEYFEIVFVDDGSNDNTFQLATNQFKNITNISILKAKNKKFIGKRGALQYGIDCSANNFIMITDADCEPEPEWIKNFVKLFKQGYDFVFGISPFKQTTTIVNKLACFENLWTHILTLSFSEVGLPYSATSRSFGFNKNSFLNIGGFDNTTDTLSGDDDLLLREAIKFKMKIGIVKSKDSFVYTESKSKMKEYFNQKVRHTKTSNYYLLKNKIILGLWHLLNTIFLISPLLMFINVQFGFLFLLKFLLDYILVTTKMKYLNYRFNLIEIIFLQIFYDVMIIVVYLSGLFTRDKWE